MNKSSILALCISIGAILIIHHEEGGSIGILLQPLAFFIVIGGTFCAAVLNFTPQVLFNAFRASISVFKKESDNSRQMISDILQIAQFARYKGILALQNVIDDIKDPFLNRGIQLCIDINDPQFIYDIMKSEISYDEEQEFINSRVFEALGGYAPTFGIVGAVLGLIQVLGDITNTEVLGLGIATAFVSTLYGVGVANLIFLPIAGNLKQSLREKILLKEVILQGIISIKMEENPSIIEEKLFAYMRFHNKKYAKFETESGIYQG